ncbi:MAG: hypothetical protein IPN17_02660 [Deltaproteobacteria bacterium]|nr:hypothetical protein [Deltaproteobacteria bacterium]
MSSLTRWTLALIVIVGCAKQSVAVDAPEADDPRPSTSPPRTPPRTSPSSMRP